MKDDDIENVKNGGRLHKDLDKFRQCRAQRDFDKQKACVEDAEDLHYRTLACKEAMENGTNQKVVQFFEELNHLSNDGAFAGEGKKLKEEIHAKRQLRLEKHFRADQEKRLLRLEASQEQTEKARVREALGGDCPYDLLGIPQEASPAQVNRAYRRISRLFHPDRCHDDDAEEVMKNLNEAKEILLERAN